MACAACLAACLAAAAGAVPLEASLRGANAAELEALRAGSTLMLYVEKPESLRLVPEGSEGDYVRRAAASRPAPFFVECAFLVKGASLSGGARRRAFAELTAVESLSAVTYHSALRDRPTPLFSEPKIVAGPGAREALPRAVPAEAPTSEGFDFYFRDANFGPSWFRVEIDGSGPGFSVALTNSRELGIAFIQAFQAGGLRMRFALAPVDEGVLVYGTCAAEPSAAASSLVDMWSAMEKRLDAVKGWVVERIGETR